MVHLVATVTLDSDISVMYTRWSAVDIYKITFRRGVLVASSSRALPDSTTIWDDLSGSSSSAVYDAQRHMWSEPSNV